MEGMEMDLKEGMDKEWKNIPEEGLNGRSRNGTNGSVQ